MIKHTDLFRLRNPHLCLPLGGTLRVSVDKTRKRDVTESVTGRVQGALSSVQLNDIPVLKTTHNCNCAMSHPRLEPVVLISSLPPVSPSRKRRHREELSDVIGSPHKRQSGSQRDKRMYVCDSRS